MGQGESSVKPGDYNFPDIINMKESTDDTLALETPYKPQFVLSKK